jgi:hypothetical protein
MTQYPTTGYTESASTTDARSFKIAMASKGYDKSHNTEAEVDRIRDFITCAELNDDPRTPAQIEQDEADIDWNQQVNELRG